MEKQAIISDRIKAAERVSVLIARPVNQPYDYLSNGMDLKIGDIVQVPFVNRMCIGVVVASVESNVANRKLKFVSDKYGEHRLPVTMLDFIARVASYNMIPLGAVLKMVLNVPEIFKSSDKIELFHQSETSYLKNFRITPSRKIVLDSLAKNGPQTSAQIVANTGVGSGVIKGLLACDVIQKQFVEDNFTSQSLRGLDENWIKLNDEQARAAKSLINVTREDKFSVSLIDGVTGSGKTEVYFEVIAEVLRKGLQILILVPEIALARPFIERFSKRFGAAPVEWHSELPTKKRRRIWRAILQGNVNVLVGARSALFLPFPNLGLLVVDEEHESAFKQMEGSRYHARDMSILRAKCTDIPIILASATPSLETLHNSETGRFRKVSLSQRYGEATLPKVELIDIRSSENRNGSWISPMLQKAIQATIERDEQVLLFLNRRGYAPLNICKVCGHRNECPSCSAWLVEHRSKSRLQCHHCGYNIKVPTFCPECDAEGSLIAAGPGVERIEEEVNQLFPDARTGIASSDTLSNGPALINFLQLVKQREIEIIIGTQVIAKGHHFPLITCVGVLDADLGLAGGDLRAAERTYQMLHQVAGRAGREERAGTVWLQTRQPDNPLMQALSTWDRESFLKLEKQARCEAKMPPFGRLVSLIISSKKEAESDQIARLLAASAPSTPRAQILGPAPSALAFLRGRHRRRLLVKADKDLNVQKMILDWLGGLKIRGSVKVEIDIDPQSFA